ncbi:BT_3044 domain-containing protein [Sphingobacterium paucimobilis]|uniref:DUF4361 domain-containing protein n=1 Tax=Sphingobacterium paucimobilis HER1398 TaxID=1346330 RepID=U2J9T5_9SPHI|nr:DUF4361 domain-containing protein [Sphingobacterium paucimobilis]ERJ59428.1 hypothetical protein M472_11645 [Sphingobacterium paucimobilis HER1398]
MKRSYITILALTMVLASCKDNAVFEKEMFKNQVALISSDYHNTFQEVVSLTGEEVVGYIAASTGGTHAPERDLVIGLVEDKEPLDKYNWALFDADDRLYARLLPKSKYEIIDYEIKVKAGERTGRTMIKLRPDGLSPDSTYFIGLKATDVSGVEINPKKNTMLYQVQIRNNYASQAEDSYYTMTGLMDGMATAANKKLFPLTKNSVRMIAGNESFESKEEAIAKTAVILDVDEDNKVTIRPYKNVKVVQLNNDPMYPNTFQVEDSFGKRSNVFLLSYQYTIGNTTRVMKERVEMQIK